MRRAIDIQDLTSIREELDTFLKAFDDVCHDHRSRDHLRTYCGGQLGPLERKCVAAIALDADVPVRTLQEFLEIHRWDHDKTRIRITQLVMERHADDNATFVIDETTFAKKGDKTVGVKRQHCGSTGKTDNCTTTVHLGYATTDFRTLVDSDVYLPQEWLDDVERREEAGIPATLIHRRKWQIGLDLVRRGRKAGLRARFLTADEEYGRCEAFRRGVAAMGLIYVVEVPRSLTGWRRCPPLILPQHDAGRAGGKRRYPGLAPTAPPPCRVDELVRRRRRSWTTFHVKDTQKGPVVWKVTKMRFYPWSDHHKGESCWLIVARNALSKETKYFLSNAPDDTPLEVLVHVAFSRSDIEGLFEAGKGHVGLDHFEVRHYQPLMRHLILSMVSLLFLEEQTQRLREKKQPLDGAAGPARGGGPVGPGDDPRGASPWPGARGAQDCPLADPQRRRGPVASQAAVQGTQAAEHLHHQAPSVFRSVLAL